MFKRLSRGEIVAGVTLVVASVVALSALVFLARVAIL